MKINRQVIKMKTLDELLSEEWEFDSDGDLFHSGTSIYVDRGMFHLLGTIILIEDGHYVENDGNKLSWSISSQMISEYLDKCDYPEYFI